MIASVRSHLLPALLVVLLFPRSATAQSFECAGEWVVDGLGLRTRNDEGNWDYLTPAVSGPRLTIHLPDGKQRERYVHAVEREYLSPVIGESRLEEVLAACVPLLSEVMERVFDGTGFPSLLEEDGTLFAPAVLPLYERHALRDRDRSSLLYAVTGNDLLRRGDDLFVLVDDRVPGEAVPLLGLTPDRLESLSGVAAEIARDLAERGATDLDDLVMEFDDHGVLHVRFEARGSSGRQSLSFRSSPPGGDDEAGYPTDGVEDQWVAHEERLRLAQSQAALWRFVRIHGGLVRSREWPAPEADSIPELYEPDEEWWSVRMEVQNTSDRSLSIETIDPAIWLVRGERPGDSPLRIAWEDGGKRWLLFQKDGQIAPGQTVVIVPIFLGDTGAELGGASLRFRDQDPLPLP